MTDAAEARADIGDALARLNGEPIHDALRFPVGVAGLFIRVRRRGDARDGPVTNKVESYPPVCA
jgi:hypothetical protein